MTLPELIDAALEISVVGSFGRSGYAVRRRLFGWAPPPAGALDGHTVLVTGPTSGLGSAAASELAALGARVILLGRNRQRLERVRAELMRAHEVDRFPVVEADMSSLASVREAVATILDSERRLDVIVDSAGAIYEHRTMTSDGLEATFGTMVVGPFALVSGLAPLLEATDGARVITVVSGGMYAQGLDLDDLQSRRGDFNGTRAYARAKRAATAIMREHARRGRGSGVRFDAMHPGWVDTPGLAKSLPGFYRLMRPLLRNPQQGIDTIIWLATGGAANEPAGRLYLDRRSRPFDRVPSTRLDLATRTRLFDAVATMARVPSPRGGPWG